MKTNKNVVVLLVVVLLIIWGKVFFVVLDNKQEVAPKVDNANLKNVSNVNSSILDSLIIPSEFEDPFRIERKKSKAFNLKKVKGNQSIKSIPGLKFKGVIGKSNNSKSLVALVNFKGNNLTLKIRDTIENYTLTQIKYDKLVFFFKGKKFENLIEK